MAETNQAKPGANGKRVSRRSFIGGVAAGAAGAWGLSHGLDRLGRDPARPPDLYEYFLDARLCWRQLIKPPIVFDAGSNHLISRVVLHFLCADTKNAIAYAVHIGRTYQRSDFIDRWRIAHRYLQ